MFGECSNVDSLMLFVYTPITNTGLPMKMKLQCRNTEGSIQVSTVTFDYSTLTLYDEYFIPPLYSNCPLLPPSRWC